MKTRSIHRIALESADVDVGRTFEAAARAGTVLGDIGADTHEAATRDARPDDLDHRATRLRGCVLSALTTAVDDAGRLEQLAEICLVATELGAGR